MPLSNKQIQKLGEKLRYDTQTSEDLELISQFRSLHQPLMNTLVNTLKNKLPKPLFMARRLKRLSSICGKLKRFQTMSLDRMQDIAGVRAVFQTNEEVEQFAQKVKKIYSQKKAKLSIEKENNYIENPKPDGYRSLHIVLRYYDKKDKENVLNSRKVELQLRDLLQHYWATAVEILALVSESNIKAGGGSEVHKRFFWLCAELLAGRATKEYIKEIKDIQNKHKILDLLNGLKLASRHINLREKTADIYLLILDYKEKNLQLMSFSNKEKETAQKLYLNNEQSKDFQAVLVSVDDVKNLKKAYPNYYLDASQFIAEILNKIK